MSIPTNPAIASALQRGALGTPTASQREPRGEEFGSMLMDVMKEVNASQLNAKQMQEDLITNRRPVEYHDVMIAAEKASTAMQLTMAIRNKLLDAYQEINRMQV